MNDKIHALLDGTLPEKDREALNDLLRTDKTARAEYAQQMKLHAMLLWRAGAVPATVPQVRQPVWRASWRWAACAAAAAALAISFTLLLVSPNPAAAAVSQIVAAWGRAMDRTYTISVLAGDPWQPLKEGRQAGYEGASLYLRGSSAFVLVRPLDHGGQVVTGSDGHTNWDIRGKGPVRVSSDAHRFRGGIPGEYQNVPFLDLGSLFSSLAADYDLTISDDAADPAMQWLHAGKRNRDKRGLPRLEFRFRRDTGTMVQMELHGLPQEKGGPRAVRLTLTSEAPLAADFFSHHAHHPSGREVINEPAGINP